MLLWVIHPTSQYEESRSRLLLLSLDKMHSRDFDDVQNIEFNATDKTRLLSAVVDLESRQAVCAAGKYQKKRKIFFLQNKYQAEPH